MQVEDHPAIVALEIPQPSPREWKFGFLNHNAGSELSFFSLVGLGDESTQVVRRIAWLERQAGGDTDEKVGESRTNAGHAIPPGLSIWHHFGLRFS